jgi:hypothetical protein
MRLASSRSDGRGTEELIPQAVVLTVSTRLIDDMFQDICRISHTIPPDAVKLMFTMMPGCKDNDGSIHEKPVEI